MTTETKGLRVEKRDGVLYLTLDAPPLNILTAALMDSFSAALEEAARAPDVKAVAVTAEGRAFSAGADVGEHRPEEAPRLMASFSRMFEGFHQLEVPVVIAVQGACLGGGFELALAADVLIAAEDAVFGQPEIRLAFIAPVGLARLPALVGPARATEITCSGRNYTAREMHEFGLLSRVVPGAELHAAVESVLKDFRKASAAVMRLNVRTLKRIEALPYREARAEAVRVFLEELLPLEDVKEGIASFYDKRRPEWKNC